METLIWAIGSMLVLLLIIIFLPLGFTKKGKLFIVLTSFVLALGGVAAISAIPLWETALLLAVLIFFVAYIIDSRLGNSLYLEKNSLTDAVKENTPVVPDTNMQEDNLLEISQNEVQLQPIQNVIVEEPSQLPDFELVNKTGSDLPEEDISFLLDPNEDILVEETIVDSETEEVYLADIESILMNDPEESIENNWLDELVEMEELSEINISEEKLKENSESQDDLKELKEFELAPSNEILLAAKEAAVGKIVLEDDDEPLKVIEK